MSKALLNGRPMPRNTDIHTQSFMYSSREPLGLILTIFLRFSRSERLKKSEKYKLERQTDRQTDWPWVFDKQATYEVRCCITDAVEVLEVERVAEGRDVGQCWQLVSTEEWRAATQTITDTCTQEIDRQAMTHTHTETQTHTDREIGYEHII